MIFTGICQSNFVPISFPSPKSLLLICILNALFTLTQGKLITFWKRLSRFMPQTRGGCIWEVQVRIIDQPSKIVEFLFMVFRFIFAELFYLQLSFNLLKCFLIIFKGHVECQFASSKRDRTVMEEGKLTACQFMTSINTNNCKINHIVLKLFQFQK